MRNEDDTFYLENVFLVEKKKEFSEIPQEL